METIWKILGVSAIFSMAIFMQILSCFAFGNNWCAAHTTTPASTTAAPRLHAPPACTNGAARCAYARLPLIILAPMLLTPVPMLLLKTCSPAEAFSEAPAGMHWAEFFSAFFFTGCFAIPILLALTDSIQWGAALTSLGGTLTLCALCGLGAYMKAKESGMLGDSLLS